MKLVIMTQPTFFVEEDKILTALFEEGMDYLHLCKPGASPMYSERLLSLLPEMSYGKITVHDHYYLKNEYGLAGIHLDGETQEPPKDYKGKYSRTCHDIATLGAMKKRRNTFSSATPSAKARTTAAARHARVQNLKRRLARGSLTSTCTPWAEWSLTTLKRPRNWASAAWWYAATCGTSSTYTASSTTRSL